MDFIKSYAVCNYLPHIWLEEYLKVGLAAFFWSSKNILEICVNIHKVNNTTKNINIYIRNKHFWLDHLH